MSKYLSEECNFKPFGYMPRDGIAGSHGILSFGRFYKLIAIVTATACSSPTVTDSLPFITPHYNFLLVVLLILDFLTLVRTALFLPR